MKADTLNVPAGLPGDWLIRYRGAGLGQVADGDMLAVADMEPVPGGLVVVTVGDEVALREFEPGVEIRGVVVGFWRSLR